MNTNDITALLAKLLKRDPESHKYDFGHIAVIGGSPGMEGAPVLAGMAALRSGAGLVTIISDVADSLPGRPPEIMTRKIDSSHEQAVDEILQFCADRKVSGLVIGPGLGADYAEFIRRLVAAIDLPLVLDAGAIAAFHAHLKELAAHGLRSGNIILTPHSGEYAKLTDKSVTDFAKTSHLIVVLKGHLTSVTSPEQMYENHTGNPGLATAGTGDVLSGIIAALRGQSLTCFEAACAAVYLHGQAGDEATKTKTQPGLIASDVIDALPTAWLSLG